MANFKKIDEARKLFGLPEYATLAEIKKAYRRLVYQYHPDQCTDQDKTECETMFKKVTEARDVLINYYKDSKLTAKVKSDMAIINTESKNIELKGNVDVISPSGNRLLTSLIYWDNQNKFFDTDEPVKIFRNNGDIIKGVGLRANYNLDDYEIKKNVVVMTKTTIKTKQKGRKRK